MTNWKVIGPKGAVVLVVIVFGSCQGDDEEITIRNQPAYPNVEAELQPYFMRFESEGLDRGLLIDLSATGIIGVIQEIEEENVAGQCSYSQHQPNLVRVDEEFWIGASDLSKEFIVFHELGHCFLGRDHLEDAYPNGRCLSIMRSGLGDCWDYYNSRSQEEYIDELFNPGLIQ